MTVAPPRGFVVDNNTMPVASSGRGQDPDNSNSVSDTRCSYGTDSECSPSLDVSYSSRRRSGDGRRGGHAYRGQALPLDAPSAPVLATANGTIVGTSIPVPVPQPSAEAQYALKLHRSNSNMIQKAHDSRGDLFCVETTGGRRASERRCSSSGIAIEKLRVLLKSGSDFEAHIQNLAEKLAPRCVDGVDTVCNVDLLGREFKTLGYSVWVRTAVGGGVEWFRHLKHRFLLVEGDPEFPEQLYVVDPNFRDQFVLARSTRQFDRVVDALPKVFVGRGKKLVPAVQLTCSEIALAFSDLDMEVPPWRRKASMISKWVPERKSDYVPGACAAVP